MQNDRNLKGWLEYEIHPSADDVAKVFWNMDEEEQAYFFNKLAELSKNNLVSQLQAITSSPHLTDEGRRIMACIGEYSAKTRE